MQMTDTDARVRGSGVSEKVGVTVWYEYSRIVAAAEKAILANEG